jgi:hypothetical protein
MAVIIIIINMVNQILYNIILKFVEPNLVSLSVVQIKQGKVSRMDRNHTIAFYNYEDNNISACYSVIHRGGLWLLNITITLVNYYIIWWLLYYNQKQNSSITSSSHSLINGVIL